MKKKFRLLSLIAIGSALFLGVTALSIASPSIFKPLEYQERNAVVNSSVTFNSFKNNSDGKAESVKSLNNGGTIRAYGSKGVYNGGAEVSSTAYVFIAYVDNGVSNSSITVADTAREMAQFQSISSVKITHDATSIVVNYSSDGVSWSTANAYSNFNVSSVSGAKYIYFSSSSRASITSILVNYSCNSEVEPVLSSIALSGTYETNFNVGDTFDSSGLVVTAYYDYGGEPQVVTSSAVISSPDMSSAGDKEVSVSYTEGGVTKSTSYNINVTEAASGLTGTYTNSSWSLVFDNSSSGRYIYGTVETINFTYTLSGTSITFTYVSGDNTNLGSKRLFDGGSSPVPNSTGIVVSNTRISVKTYNMFGSATTSYFDK